ETFKKTSLAFKKVSYLGISYLRTGINLIFHRTFGITLFLFSILTQFINIKRRRACHVTALFSFNYVNY
ncbi:hypothetical protein, partial [Alkalibacterium iburiense]|uniref:hypothetical protein n=1 Tax=Alkalibacterium iburiense TaxID=290589 RepID=UPI0031D2F61C